MKISDVIKSVDMLYTNEYTEDEKLYWAYEVSAIITESVMERYGKIKAEKDENGIFLIPPYISFDDIVKVIADRCEIAKTDCLGENEFLEETFGANEVYVVYKKHTDEYKRKIISGESVTFTKADDKNFYFEFSGDVKKGDILVICTDGEDTKYEVIKAADNRIYAKGDLNGEKLCDIYVIKDADTLVKAPYEGMYIYYILAKILFNQGDVDGYNRNMEMFQYIFASFSSEYKKNAPQRNLKYKNWW